MKIGEFLVQKNLITEEQLEEALYYQEKYGGRLGWILASLGYINRLDLFKAFAEHFGIEFLYDLEQIKSLIDKDFLLKFNPYELSQYEVIPAKNIDNKIILLTSNPESYKLDNFIKKYFPNKNIEKIIITDLDLIKILEIYFKENFIDRAVHGLLYMSPQYSASMVFSKGQVFLMGLFLYASLLWIYKNPISYFTFILLITQLFYLLAIGFKFIVSLAGTKSEIQQTVTDNEVKALSEENLPVYTVLVPVYKEPEVI
ncbi:MAG: hypothetical protein ACP5S8_08035, partial [Hydrogenobaculum sp.]